MVDDVADKLNPAENNFAMDSSFKEQHFSLSLYHEMAIIGGSSPKCKCLVAFNLHSAIEVWY